MLPSKFDTSPRSHSPRKKADRPEVDRKSKFLSICGTCANNHDKIDRTPRSEDSKASGVGIQDPNVKEMLRRKSLVGSQCCGNSGEVPNMIWRVIAATYKSSNIPGRMFIVYIESVTLRSVINAISSIIKNDVKWLSCECLPRIGWGQIWISRV